MEGIEIAGGFYPKYERPAAVDVNPHAVEEWGYKENPISTTKDPGWIRPALVPLYDEGVKLLADVGKAVDQVAATSWDDYKPEVAAAKKAEAVRGPMDYLHTKLTEKIEAAFAKVEQVDNLILAASAPARPKDQTAALIGEMQSREIRDYLRALDVKERLAVVKKALDTGDFRIFGAAQDAFPPLFDRENLNGMRREWAIKKAPWLQQWRDDAEVTAMFTLARARRIAGAAGFGQVYRKLKLDYVPPERAKKVWDRFGRFDPESWIDENLAARGESLKKIAERR
jgi:hypothetical protein